MDGKYDVLKNLQRYNVIIAADYTTEYNLCQREDIQFVNPISASALGIPERCIAIYRGISDFENPVDIDLDVMTEYAVKGIITLHVKNPLHILELGSPMVMEIFDYDKHTEAIKSILIKHGFNPADIIIDENAPDADVVLNPVHLNLKSNWAIEPPNPYSDIVRKICNEFSGWILNYSPYSHKIIYEPRRFKVDTTLKSFSKFYLHQEDYENEYKINPVNTYKIIGSPKETRIRPIATSMAVHGGTVIPVAHAAYQRTNKRAIEDPRYEFYVGKFIHVNVYYPLSSDLKVLKMIADNLSARILLGHRIIRFEATGSPPRYNSPCWVQGYGYGIIKESTSGFEQGEFFKSEYVVELANKQVGNDYYVYFFDEL